MSKRPYFLVAPLVALAWMAAASGPLGPQTFPDVVDATLTQDDVDALVRRGARSLPELENQAGSGPETSRGWAVVGIARIGGPEADAALVRLQEDGDQSELVRTWSAAARIQMADDLDAIVALAPLIQRFPGTSRPFEAAIDRVSGQVTDVAQALKLIATVPSVAPALGRAVMESPAEDIVQVMFTHPEQNVRWQAASYAAAAGQDRNGEVARATADALRYNPRASAVPWDGGALYVPGIQWERGQARAVIGELGNWYAWAQRNDDQAAQTQIMNNLRSISLLRAAGYGSAEDAVRGGR